MERGPITKKQNYNLNLDVEKPTQGSPSAPEKHIFLSNQLSFSTISIKSTNGTTAPHTFNSKEPSHLHSREDLVHSFPTSALQTESLIYIVGATKDDQALENTAKCQLYNKQCELRTALKHHNQYSIPVTFQIFLLTT